jgi:hypothetical protein
VFPLSFEGALKRGFDLMDRRVDGYLVGVCVAGHGQGLLPVDPCLDHTSFVVCAAFVSVLIPKVDLEAADPVAEAAKGLGDLFAEAASKVFIAAYIVVGVYLNCHAPLLQN